MTTPADHLPRVSVCIPMYNADKFIAATIQSVLDQTFEDWELLILDNGSTDASAEIVRAFDDQRIQVTRTEDTVPAADNWTRVVGLARGEYVKILCADDIIHADCLQTQVDILDTHPDVAMVACRRHLISETGEVILPDRGLRGLLGRQRAGTVVRSVVRSGINSLGESAAMLMRRTDLRDAGPFDADLHSPMDLEMWFRILRRGDFYGQAVSSASFRLVATSAGQAARHGTEYRILLRRLMDEADWHIPRTTYRRGWALSHLASAKRHLLFAAANHRLRAIRVLPGLVFGIASR